MEVALPGSYRTKQADAHADLHIDEHAEEEERVKMERALIRHENYSLCRSIMIFLVYLGVFTIAMFLESSDTSSRFADHIRDLLDGGGPEHHAIMTMNKIGVPADVHTFIDQVFIPALWMNSTDTNQAEALSTYLHPIDISNRLVGPARVRQVRVKAKDNCQPDPMFETYAINCYRRFSAGGVMTEANEDKGAFGPDGKYQWAEDSLGTGYTGSMATYPADGYMAYLFVNRTTAMMTNAMLRTDDFLGDQTRAVFIDFTAWNSNRGIYAACRIAIEFGPAGTVATYLEISVLSEHMMKAGGFGSLKDWAALIFVLLIMCFVLWFLIEEAQELYADKMGYFLDGWNVLDWINMLLLIIAFVFRIMVFVDAGSAGLGEPQLENADAWTSIRGLVSKAELVRLLHSFNAVLLWGKCSKYFRHLPIVKVLVKTIWDAFALFLPLMTMFTIGLLGFTMAYHIGFGDKIQELTSFTRALVYLSRSFLRDVELMPVYHITPIFGAFLILLFYVMLVLVGVQVLFAIVADAMYRSKVHPHEFEDEMHRDEPLEEVTRDATVASKQILRKVLPGFMTKVLFPRPALKGRQPGAASQPGAEHLKLKDGMDFAGTESTYSMSTESVEKSFTTHEIMLAIQHMSGRVLSEVQEVGIEIKSELHDVCERVAQMQMAVEELSWRAELVRREQEVYL
jgi:hypothetical protein